MEIKENVRAREQGKRRAGMNRNKGRKKGGMFARNKRVKGIKKLKQTIVKWERETEKMGCRLGRMGESASAVVCV